VPLHGGTNNLPEANAEGRGFLDGPAVIEQNGGAPPPLVCTAAEKELPRAPTRAVSVLVQAGTRQE
jgi:hypothetical protein